MEQKIYSCEELFTLKEAAKICQLSKQAMYMHYYRGHIERVPMKAHKLYFSAKQIQEFQYNYLYGIVNLF